MIVMKFGGTSNRDAAAIRNVIEIITTHLPLRPVVVISAIAKATNELEKMARTAARGEHSTSEEVLSHFISRHAEIVASLFPPGHRRDELEALLATARAAIAQLIQGVSILRELTPRTMDAFCAFGERLSSAIVAAGLQQSGRNAAWVDAGEFMITDDHHGNALPLMSRVTHRLSAIVRPMVDAGVVPVTQGFIGVTEDGVPTTMGRESSDFSASIIGAAMHADLVQIWTDVDGILTADPSVVHEIHKIPSMTFDEAFELSYFGAKVLHPNTMLPLLEENIPVEVRNSAKSREEGTRIEKRPERGDLRGGVKSIAYQRGMSLITVRPRKRSDQYLFWEGVFSVLSRQGMRSRATSASEQCIALAVAEKIDATSLCNALEEFGIVRVQPGKASITLVGEGLGTMKGFAARVFAVLSEMTVDMVSFGASELSLTLVLDEVLVDRALQGLHEAFFSG